MTVTASLEDLAKDTWERLRDSRDLQIRFGEETVTDLVLLELKRRKDAGIHIIQTDKHKESISGTDWEWWLGSPRVGWLLFAIQAKRLTLSSSRYDQLNHRVGTDKQIDLLEKYAKEHKAIPMYCLFNFADAPATTRAWQCCQGFQEEQLACTMVPSRVIREALAGRGRRTFSRIHSSPQCLPWRCLARCPKVLALYTQDRGADSPQPPQESIFGGPVVIHDSLPGPIQGAREVGYLALADRGQSTEAQRMQPRQIVVLELTPDEEDREVSG